MLEGERPHPRFLEDDLKFRTTMESFVVTIVYICRSKNCFQPLRTPTAEIAWQKFRQICNFSRKCALFDPDELADFSRAQNRPEMYFMTLL